MCLWLRGGVRLWVRGVYTPPWTHTRYWNAFLLLKLSGLFNQHKPLFRIIKICRISMLNSGLLLNKSKNEKKSRVPLH